MNKNSPKVQKEEGSDFICDKCGMYHFQNLETAFQRATGNDFIWRCACGHEILLVGAAKENALTAEQFIEVQKRVLSTRREAQLKLIDDLLSSVASFCANASKDLQKLLSMQNELIDNHLIHDCNALWQLWERYSGKALKP